MTEKTDSTAIQLTPKIILIFLLGIASPIAGGIYTFAQMQSRLSNLEDSISSIPSGDNSAILERITAVEINSKNNTNGVEKLDADIDKIVEHVDKSFRKITDNLNSNPLSLGN